MTTERAPTRRPHGVMPIHRAFYCEAGCDNGRVPAGDSPNSEGYRSCRECMGAGRYSSVRCSECGDLITHKDVRSVDNFYVYCQTCTEKLCKLEVAR